MRLEEKIKELSENVKRFLSDEKLMQENALPENNFFTARTLFALRGKTETAGILTAMTV